MFINLHYSSGEIHYRGNVISGKIAKQLSRQKMTDDVGLFLTFFEGMVHEFDKKGNCIRKFKMKNGKHVPLERKKEQIGSTFYSGEIDEHGLWCGTGMCIHEYDTKELQFFYIGNFLDGKRCGHGVLYNKRKQKMYEGNWFENKPSGQGQSFYENGNVFYDGLWMSAHPHNKCKIYEEDGTFGFEGDWNNYVGFAVFTNMWNGEITYKGHIKYGKFDGYGVCTQQTAYKLYTYFGDFKNGKYHGNGELEIYECDSFFYYRGGFKNGLPHGYGYECHSFAGDLFAMGFYENGKKNGHGIIFQDDSSSIEKLDVDIDFPFDYSEKKFISYMESIPSNQLIFKGIFKNNYYHKGTTFYENGNPHYHGDFFKENSDEYHGHGILYYTNGQKCYDGFWRSNSQLGEGEFFSEDGKSVISNEYRNGDWYGYGIYMGYENDTRVFYHGNLKNGLAHGEGIIFEYKSATSTEIEFVFSGDFFNGKYYDNGSLFDMENEVVFEGSCDDQGEFITGIELVRLDDGSYEEVEWKDGKITDVEKKRKNMRERMKLLDYLETKEKRKISKISKKACIQLYQEMSNEKKRKRTSKKKLLNHLLFLRKQKKDENSPKENYDLFGNEICSPVRGFDDKIYDFRSMVKQFQIDTKKKYKFISYSSYDVPNFPTTGHSKRLEGFYLENHDFCNQVEQSKDEYIFYKDDIEILRKKK